MDQILEIKRRLRLEEYMQESGVEFVRKTKDSWTARCWKHQDKTPSLVVSIGKGLFYCHSTGCAIGGDVITFHEEFNCSDKATAIRELAGRLGLETQADAHDAGYRIRESMQRVTEACTIGLFSERGKGALRYCKDRGVTEEVLCAFKVGYSPSREWLRSVATGLSETELHSMEFDSMKYQDSLVLPCTDPISGDIAHYVRPFRSSSAKYMGPSGSNPSRWKGMLFGLDVARRHAREGAILVEGQFDCLTLHSYGFSNTICVLGSHPMPEQLARLGDLHIRRATVLFDNDKAGQTGAEQVLFSTSVKCAIARLPEGDPDDYVRNHGREGLQNILDQALLPVDYIIDKWKGALDGAVNTSSLSMGLEGAIADLNRMPPADKLAGISSLSRLCSLPVDSLLDLIKESEPDKSETIQSERQVLAMCVKNPEYVTFLDGLPTGVFTLSKHKETLRRIQECTSRGASEITYELLGLKENDWIFTAEPSNFEYHLRSIKDSHSRRQLATAAKSLLRSTADPERSIQDIVSGHLREVSSGASPTDKVEFTSQEVVDDAMSYIHERMANPESLPGFDLGPRWGNTTKITLGLQRNRLYLVGAGPKVGKTSLALNWALALAVDKKVPTLWVNLEMSERDLMIRAFSILSGISSLRVQSGALATKEKEILDSHAAEIYASPFHILNGHGMSVQEIISAIRKYVYTQAVQLTFIDYIQLLNVSGGSRLDYWERHAEISTSLKAAINANLNIPVVALSQLGRPAASEGSSSGSFIGGSYKYVQDCDVFMGLRVRSDKELEDGQGGNLILNVEYNRHGPQDVYTRIYFNRDNLRMEEVE